MNKLKKMILGKKSPKHSVEFKVIVSVLSLLLVLTVWFLADSFWVIMHQTVLNAGDTEYLGDDLPQVVPIDDGTGDAGSGSKYGESGVSMMLLNSMSSGWYKDVLVAIKEQCDWSKMNSAVDEIMLNGEVIHPPISFVLGQSISESSYDTSDMISPRVPLLRSAYNAEDGKHTPLTYTSAVAKADGYSTLRSDLTGSYKAEYGGAFTYFQFTGAWHFAQYPTGATGNESTKYPSAMIGYGMSSPRTKRSTDATFYPDLVSAAIQHSWQGTMDALDKQAQLLTKEGLMTFAYPVFNQGPKKAVASWGPGLNSSDTGKMSLDGGASGKNALAASGANQIGALLFEFMDKFFEKGESYAPEWRISSTQLPLCYNHEDYAGLMMGIVLEGGGYLNAKEHAHFQSRWKSEVGFQRGLAIAYRVLVNENGTINDAFDYFYGKPVKENPSGYELYEDNNLRVYLEDPSLKVNYKGTVYSAVHDIKADVLRGPGIVNIAGVCMYWKMLLAGGVECTLEDAYLDAMGKKPIAGNDITGDGSGSYYSDSGSDVWGSYKEGKPVLDETDIISFVECRDISVSSGIHYGQDLLASYIPAIAITDGKVVRATYGTTGTYPSGGNSILVQATRKNASEPTIQYYYMHLKNQQIVKANDFIQKGQVVGITGKTGRVSGAHLHIQIMAKWNDRASTYCYDYYALHHGLYSIATGPRLLYDLVAGKLARGYVYDESFQTIGTLRDSYLHHGHTANGYMSQGINGVYYKHLGEGGSSG